MKAVDGLVRGCLINVHFGFCRLLLSYLVAQVFSSQGSYY